MNTKQMLKEKRDWLRSTYGATHAPVRLTVEELDEILRAFDLAEEYAAFRQAVLDPENQPSQFGTVLADHQFMLHPSEVGLRSSWGRLREWIRGK